MHKVGAKPHPHAPDEVQQRIIPTVHVLVQVAGVQGGAAHLPEVQMPEVQSAGAAQSFPFAHLAVQLPPQSTSVSFPFLAASVQVAVAHRPPVQAPSISLTSGRFCV